MALFTVVLDYQGGTYISQVSARTVAQATVKWAEGLQVNEIDGMGAASKREMIRQVTSKKTEPAPLTGLKNAWCHVSSIRGKLALVNIIMTSV